MQTTLKKDILTAPLLYAGLLAVGAGLVMIGWVISGFSALLAAIILGTLIGNLPLGKVFQNLPIAAVTKRLLRIGIMFLGFRLSFQHLLDIGLGSVIMLIATVGITFVLTVQIGKKLGLTKSFSTLIATGFSICGASAIAAMAEVVESKTKKEETAQAIALVTIFGTLAMLLFPLLSRAFGLTDEESGLWFGASIHEVAQVVAAGGMISSVALSLATVAKLSRVVLLAPLVAIVTAVQHRSTKKLATQNTEQSQVKRPPILPLFVALFLGAVVLRSVVPLNGFTLTSLETTSNIFLAAAMVGLGYSINIKKVINTGWRPLALGALSTLIAAGVSLGLILLLGLGI